MDFGFLLDPDRKLLSIGYRVADGAPRSELLRPARFRGAPGKLRGDRQGRRSGAALVSARARRDADRARRGADLLVGIDVRVPDAVARHARAGGQPAGADQSSRSCAGRSTYGAALGLPWGISESAYNVARPGVHLSVFELRRARPGSEARSERERRRRALCDGACGDGRSQAAARNFTDSPPSARAAATASTRRWITRARACPKARDVAIVRAYMAHHQGMTIVAIANALLDGAMRARFHAEPIIQATELLLQERTPRDVAVAQPRAEEVRAAATDRDLELPAVRRLPLRARRHAGDASAIERPLRGDGDRRRLRIQPLARSWRHALARGCHLRRLGRLHLSARCAERRGLVGGLSAERRRTGQLRGHVHRGSGRVRADATERSRRPSKSSFRRRTTPKSAACRSRTRATGPRTSRSPRTRNWCWRRRGGRGAPGLFEAFRANRVSRQGRRHSGNAPPALARRARNLGGASCRRRRRDGGRAGDRNRPGALPRPGTRSAGADRGDGRPSALEYRRHGPRSRLRLRCRVRIAPGQDGAHRLLDGRRIVPRRGAGPRSTSIEDTNAFERAGTLAWTQAQVQLRHLGIDADEASLFQRLAGHVLYADPSLRPSSDAIRRGGGGPRRSGPRASPAIFRSFWCGSTHRGHRHRPPVAAGS